MAQYGGNDTFPELAELVNDGSGRDAGSVDVPLEALFDRTRYLGNRHVRVTYHVAYDDDGDSIAALAPTSTYADWLPAGSNVFYVDVPSVAPTDVLLIDCSSGLEFVADGVDDQSFVRIVAVAPNASVVVPAGASSFSELRNSRFPFSISTRLVAAQSGTYRIKLQGKTKNGGVGEITLYHSFSLRVVHLKHKP
ncbi:hypothetical protein [Sorangium sp. So ce693]|uniref:hypothetical protein n=1 Tax=Sorangium sp. So ce693 TaxID=3133318 RepID=UPI003F6328AA